MTNGLYDYLRPRFADRLARDWLIPDDRPVISYGEMDEAVARVVGALGDLGVVPGDRVCVQTSKSPESVVTYLGVVRSGAVYLPLNPSYRSAEVEYFLSDARPRLLIGTSGESEWQADVADRCGVAHFETLETDGSGSWTERLRATPPAALFPPIEGSDLAAILYTSGTTGRSKGAMISHSNLITNAEALSRAWGFGPDDVLLHVLPVFHVHGLFVALHPAMANANPIRFHSRFDPGAVIRDLPNSTVLMAVPTMYGRLLAEPGLTSEVGEGMRLFTSGSAPLRPETFDAFSRRMGHDIVERYGMTETQIICSARVGERAVAGSVGRPLDGVLVRIVGPEGETGTVQVKGPNVGPGYWEMPERTAEETTADGWFRTGDLGYLDTEGRLHLVGRSKDLIISGGLNVYPAEVEKYLDSLPGVAESAVIGIPEPDFGEAAVAVVVGDGSINLVPDEVIDQLKGSLARFKVPRLVVLVDELPRNAMGKVQKGELRRLYADCLP